MVLGNFSTKIKLPTVYLFSKGPIKIFVFAQFEINFLRTKYIPSYTSLVSDGKIKLDWTGNVIKFMTPGQ